MLNAFITCGFRTLITFDFRSALICPIDWLNISLSILIELMLELIPILRIDLRNSVLFKRLSSLFIK